MIDEDKEVLAALQPAPHRHAFTWTAAHIDVGLPVPPDEAPCDCGLTFGQYKAESLKRADPS